jgi:hypothetical protein
LTLIVLNWLLTYLFLNYSLADYLFFNCAVEDGINPICS